MLLKDIYSDEFFKKFIAAILKKMPTFPEKEFLKFIRNEEWENAALKQRASRIATALFQFLPNNFHENVLFIRDCIPEWEKSGFKKQNLEFIFLPEILSTYGISEPEFSLNMLEIITDFVSAEFAVRYFMLENEALVLAKMTSWTQHSSENVRRLASEGSRPRLPWGIALKTFQKNPLPTLPILRSLYADESEYVRRSTANHWNDISKDNPEIFIAELKKEVGQNAQKDALFKHAARTLLKKGNAEVLQCFGMEKKSTSTVGNLTVSAKRLRKGETLDFSCLVRAEKSEKIRLEYAVCYQKSGDKTSRKVFQIFEKYFEQGEEKNIAKKISFRDLTTRKHYAGEHRLEILLNGDVKAECVFDLTE